jgi:hypothetical protein
MRGCSKNTNPLTHKVSLLFPILGKVLLRDLSPLKPVLVEGVWDRTRSRLVPLSAGRTVPIRDF